MKKNKGFTIIELMITVAIIGILAALFFPKDDNYLSSEDIEQIKHRGGIPQLVAPAAHTNPVFVRD